MPGPAVCAVVVTYDFETEHARQRRHIHLALVFVARHDVDGVPTPEFGPPLPPVLATPGQLFGGPPGTGPQSALARPGKSTLAATTITARIRVPRLWTSWEERPRVARRGVSNRIKVFIEGLISVCSTFRRLACIRAGRNGRGR